MSAFSHRCHSHYISYPLTRILFIKSFLNVKYTFAQLLSMPVWPLPPIPLLCHLSHALPLVFSFSSTFRCTSLFFLSFIHLSHALPLVFSVSPTYRCTLIPPISIIFIPIHCLSPYLYYLSSHAILSPHLYLFHLCSHTLFITLSLLSYISSQSYPPPPSCSPSSFSFMNVQPLLDCA